MLKLSNAVREKRAMELAMTIMLTDTYSTAEANTAAGRSLDHILRPNGKPICDVRYPLNHLWPKNWVENHDIELHHTSVTEYFREFNKWNCETCMWVLDRAYKLLDEWFPQ